MCQKTPLFNNTLPIHRKIYDIGNMRLYKKHKYITLLNPRAELVRVQTDLLGYVNIENEIDTDDYTWGEVKREWLPPKPGQIRDITTLARTTTFGYNNKDWYVHKRIELDDDDLKSIITYGGLLNGEGGTGKSTTIDKMKNA